MNKLIFLAAIIPVLMLLVPNVNASGPRQDSDDAYDQIPGAHDCYVDGYDAGFANKYDEDRGKECKDKGDQYNAGFGYGCKDSGLTEQDCDDVKKGNDDLGSHKQLQEENRRNCYDDGFEDGQNNPFDHDRRSGCSDYNDSYYRGFIAGCESSGNTKETCERFTDE